MQECKNIEIFKSVKNDLGAANFKRNKITQNGTDTKWNSNSVSSYLKIVAQ